MTRKASTQTASAAQEVKLQRRWDIDWLRVVAVVVLLIPYHTNLVFNIYDDWFVKNDQYSTALDPFQFLGDAVGMQLLFLLGALRRSLSAGSPEVPVIEGQALRPPKIPLEIEVAQADARRWFDFRR